MRRDAEENQVGVAAPMPGGCFIIWADGEIQGWVHALSAWQALDTAVPAPENPRYKAHSWSICKVSEQQDALKEGRITSKIIEGCPCPELHRLRAENGRLTQELADARKELDALKSPAFQTPSGRGNGKVKR